TVPRFATPGDGSVSREVSVPALAVQPETAGPLPGRYRPLDLDALTVVVHRLTSLLAQQRIYDPTAAPCSAGMKHPQDFVRPSGVWQSGADHDSSFRRRSSNRLMY